MVVLLQMTTADLKKVATNFGIIKIFNMDEKSVFLYGCKTWKFNKTITFGLLQAYKQINTEIKRTCFESFPTPIQPNVK